MVLDRRYEKQMTREERKQFEKGKLSQMTGKEKLEYLWMYYKIWLFGSGRCHCCNLSGRYYVSRDEMRDFKSGRCRWILRRL